MIRRRDLLWMLLPLAGCAAMPGHDPVQVQVVDVESMEGEGMELRFLCKLRVQNPNNAPIAYNGIYIDLEVRGSSFATGVSNEAGTVPGFGEVVVAVPVTVSAMRVIGQAVGMYMSEDHTHIDYVLKGKIGGSTWSPVRFESKGQIDLSGSKSAGAPATPTTGTTDPSR
jgi:LEA14-like dessication related protein